MNTERIPLDGRDLWRRLATDRAGASAAITDMDFAAWLEGRLPEAAAARIEAAVAADPEMRRAALDLSEILGMPLPAAPPRMAVRAQALVGFAAERQTKRVSWLAWLLPNFSGGFSLQRGAMAGAAIMLAAVGFMMGGGLGESYAHEKNAKTTVAKPLGVDTTNELADLFTSGI